MHKIPRGLSAQFANSIECLKETANKPTRIILKTKLRQIPRQHNIPPMAPLIFDKECNIKHATLLALPSQTLNLIKTRQTYPIN